MAGAVLWCAITLPVDAQSIPGRDTARGAVFRLVRCGPQRSAACLSTRLALPPGAVIGGGTDSLAMQWSGRLAGAPMIGPTQPMVSGATQPDVTPVFGAPIVTGTALGRTALRGVVMLDVGRRAVVTVPATWSPPRLALPMFEGVADTLSLPAAMRDALAAGGEAASVRPMMALVLALTGLMLVVFVPRFLWHVQRDSDEDMARQVIAARALLSTQELEELRGKAPREGKPRHPDEPTHESAIQPRP
jgi:hypothetical protein